MLLKLQRAAVLRQCFGSASAVLREDLGGRRSGSFSGELSLGKRVFFPTICSRETLWYSRRDSLPTTLVCKCAGTERTHAHLVALTASRRGCRRSPGPSGPPPSTARRSDAPPRLTMSSAYDREVTFSIVHRDSLFARVTSQDLSLTLKEETPLFLLFLACMQGKCGQPHSTLGPTYIKYKGPCSVGCG